MTAAERHAELREMDAYIDKQRKRNPSEERDRDLAVLIQEREQFIKRTEAEK